MEKSLFVWKRFTAEDDELAFRFFQCTLLKDVGPFLIGDLIPCVYLSFDSGSMVFYDQDWNITHSFQLELAVAS